MSARDATEPDVAQQDTERSFDRLVEEGEQRLGRSWSGLISTGLLGGLDIGVGVLALLLVESITDSKLLGGLAFSIGFITLTLARSELFTEDFLVPIAAVATKASPPLALARLWGVTIACRGGLGLRRASVAKLRAAGKRPVHDQRAQAAGSGGGEERLAVATDHARHKE